jgi:hypothetical protein
VFPSSSPSSRTSCLNGLCGSLSMALAIDVSVRLQPDV